jgi:hypothetical protein
LPKEPGRWAEDSSDQAGTRKILKPAAAAADGALMRSRFVPFHFSVRPPCASMLPRQPPRQPPCQPSLKLVPSSHK